MSVEGPKMADNTGNPMKPTLPNVSIKRNTPLCPSRTPRSFVTRNASAVMMAKLTIDSPMVMRISVDPGSESAVSTEPKIIAGSAVFKMSFDRPLSMVLSMTWAFFAIYPIDISKNKMTIVPRMLRNSPSIPVVPPCR